MVRSAMDMKDKILLSWFAIADPQPKVYVEVGIALDIEQWPREIYMLPCNTMTYSYDIM